ncbi:MAG: hypothetical protein ACM35G_06755, partial [Planctomycetaceae bacterium]
SSEALSSRFYTEGELAIPDSIAASDQWHPAPNEARFANGLRVPARDFLQTRRRSQALAPNEPNDPESHCRPKSVARRRLDGDNKGWEALTFAGTLPSGVGIDGNSA